MTIFLFLILKLTNSLLLSWWWIFGAALIDVLLSVNMRKKTESAYLNGIEEAKQDSYERIDSDLI